MITYSVFPGVDVVGSASMRHCGGAGLLTRNRRGQAVNHVRFQWPH